MSEHIANAIAYGVASLAFVFIFMFDRSSGWALGLIKLKIEFIKYGWPLVKMLGVFSIVYSVIYSLALFLLGPK